MTIARDICPTVSQDWADWDFGQNPYPAFEEWRKLGPVVYNDRHDEYLVLGYRGCARTLANVRNFSSQDLEELFIQTFGGVTMEAIDTPRHHAMRGVWSGYFERQALECHRRLVEEIVESQVGPFVERVRSGEVVDAISNMTRAVPTLVIARMLGVDESMHRQFSAWSDAMGSTQEGTYDLATERGQRVVAAGRAATAALNAYLADVIKGRRAAGPGDGGPGEDRAGGDRAGEDRAGEDRAGEDLVSMMVHHSFAREMTEQEIIASNTQLVFAGNETTAKLMATTLVALARHPDQRRALCADRSLIPRAIEEVHRWQTIVQTLPRRASSDESDVEGVRIPRGAKVRVVLAAGNRDSQRWDHPERLDIHREPRQHLGFGFGMHVCLGLNLARLELQVWLNRLLDLLPDFDVSGDIVYSRGLGLHGPVAVPLVAS
jgi:cytochrome P450